MAVHAADYEELRILMNLIFLLTISTREEEEEEREKKKEERLLVILRDELQ
ncbi:hypothetical protein PPACK8108_LOCUS4268 [Phakopsora pachyrhizi]|uniref:Uncharacterized protein n=1 Tax=Phakopsora pachyrhizi TaxID=170000 RepID=A0AAV0AM40_PHAPC|nr:hypothetical protein PPACK8108_LOCUS4268 [Phakopsora pachyrhizi]